MNNIQKQKLLLGGLSCANCAIKIESAVSQLKGIENVSLNFATKSLSFETKKDRNVNSVIEEIATTVQQIEPEVTVQPTKEALKQVDLLKAPKNIRDILIGSIFFLLAILFDFPAKFEFILFLLGYLILGKSILQRAGRNMLRGELFDENFLMSIATIGAFVLGEFAEGVAVMLFYQIGEMFQDMAVNRSQRSISALLDIRPDFATVKRGENIKQTSPEAVEIGEIILVRPGEKIPLDGIIVEGSSALDTSALTGESMPREVFVGDTVQSGCINQSGLLTIKTTTMFEESTVSQILDLVQNAAHKKSPTENFITKFSRYYTPIIIASAALIAIIPPIFLHYGDAKTWLYRALVFLVISCPCALVISIPLGFFGGIGAASKKGVLVKGSNYLDGLNDVDTVVFDKTGTLTKGIFEVVDIIPRNGITPEILLRYAALAESHSNHPIAHSILDAYGQKIDFNMIDNYEEMPGYGVKAIIQGKEILSGNSKLLDSANISYKNLDTDGTIVYIALDKEWIGAIVIKDTVKQDSNFTIRTLKKMGIKNISLLTGDNAETGKRIGKELGLDNIYAGLLPHEKVEKLEIIQQNNTRGKKIAFIGDGINDAPVLARADISIAMGGLGSDAAIEASDIVFMTDEPSKLVDAIQIAKKTRRIIWQNIALAIGTKTIVLTMGVLGIATMWAAVFADVGVALLAILNAMRILRE